MSKYDLDPGMIAADLCIPSDYYNEIVEAMKKYGRLVRDCTLEWAAENADTSSQSNYDFDGSYIGENYGIDKHSILSGKTHKDLDI